MMSTRFCAVCTLASSTSSNFWSFDYDRPEYCQESFIKLQSFKCMHKEAERGCQLCRVLLNFPQSVKVEDESATLILRRCPAYPDRAVRLGTGPKGMKYITRTFFRRVPTWWRELPSSTMGREYATCKFDQIASLDAPVDNIGLMKMWLQNCQKDHNVCSSRQKSFLPTRLLDLQAFDDSLDIQLRETESMKSMLDRKRIQYPDYLTLSHCWGEDKKHFFTTNKENYCQRVKRIHVNELPKTFRDAVAIARKLGQRYLWIDSLCVIQGSIEDWAVEAALMADVYGNAYCTLSALSSKDGTQGCRMTSDLRKSTGNSYLEFQVHRDTQTHVRMYRQPPANWSVEYEEEVTDSGQSIIRNPLRYRAWTLQEAELSRRSIFFADRQLLWRCRELKGTTELPWVEQLPDEVFKMKPWPLCDGLQDDHTEGFFSNMRLRWYELVEDYSLRSLTYDSDKLTALAGLARNHQDVFPGAQYVAGMWGVHIPRAPLFPLSDNAHLHNDLRQKLHAGTSAIGAHCSATLLWRSLNRNSQRYIQDEYIAPTWSWASVKGRISYDSQRIEPHGNSFHRMGVRENLSDCDFGVLHWESMHAEPKNGDPYGAIKRGAYLNLRGASITQCSVPKESSSSKYFDEYNSVKSREDLAFQQLMESLSPVEDMMDTDGEPLRKDGKTVGVFFRDSADDTLWSQGDAYCLRIRGEPVFSMTRHKFKSEQESNDMNMIMGIVLIRTWNQELGDVYQRIGLARWVSVTAFLQSLPMSLKLV